MSSRKTGQRTHTNTVPVKKKKKKKKGNTMWLTVGALLCLVGRRSVASLLLFVSNLFFISLSLVSLSIPAFSAMSSIHPRSLSLCSFVFRTPLLLKWTSGFFNHSALLLLYLLGAPYISNTAPYIPGQMAWPAHSLWLTTQLLKSGLNPIHSQSIADKALTDRASPLLLPSPSPLFVASLFTQLLTQVNNWMKQLSWGIR